MSDSRGCICKAEGLNQQDLEQVSDLCMRGRVGVSELRHRRGVGGVV
jgi:hypothetical protein